MPEKEIRLLVDDKAVIEDEDEDEDENWYRNNGRLERNEGETFITALKKNITTYVNSDVGKKNTWKTAKEWLKITGLCGFKNKTTHHSSMMKELVKCFFLERKDNKLRVRVQN